MRSEDVPWSKTIAIDRIVKVLCSTDLRDRPRDAQRVPREREKTVIMIILGGRRERCDVHKGLSTARGSFHPASSAQVAPSRDAPCSG